MSLQTGIEALKKIHEEEIQSNETQKKEILNALRVKEEEVLRLNGEIESLIRSHEEASKNNESKIKEIKDDLRAKDEQIESLQSELS